jgi:hypothetical protein
MKKLILTNEQLKRCLKEAAENSTTLQFATNNPSNTLSNGNTQRQITQAQNTFGGNTNVLLTPPGGTADATINIPTTGNGLTGAIEAVSDNNNEVQKGLSSGKFNVSVDVSECKKYTKAQIQEAKIKKMISESYRLTKKDMQQIAKKIKNG